MSEEVLFARLRRNQIPAKKICLKMVRCVAFAEIARKRRRTFLIARKDTLRRLARAAELRTTAVLGKMSLVAAETGGERKLQAVIGTVVKHGEQGGADVFNLHMHLLAEGRFHWPFGLARNEAKFLVLIPRVGVDLVTGKCLGRLKRNSKSPQGPALKLREREPPSGHEFRCREKLFCGG